LSILTKICVVVLSVLIIFGCAIFIKQATVGPNYRQAYEQEQSRAKAYQLDAMVEKQAHNTARLQRDQAQAELVEDTEQNRTMVDKLTADLATARATVASLQGSFATLGAKLGALEVDTANANKRNDQLAAQLDASRKESDDLNKEVIRLNELVKQTEAEKARAELLARGHAETIRDLEDELDNIRRSGATAGASTASGQTSPVASDEIIGTVTAVKDGTASVNIGSAKGIRADMKLIIYRGNTLVGWLRMDEVDVDQAAGIIVDPQMAPAPGDKVTTRALK
jgi:septal ring factor EnvC (AmiA/AmiB activator)